MIFFIYLVPQNKKQPCKSIAAAKRQAREKRRQGSKFGASPQWILRVYIAKNTFTTLIDHFTDLYAFTKP
jgi:hypothetical protein